MIKIQRLSTATFKITSPEGKVIMIDPWLVNDPLWPADERDPAKLAEVNIILVTHAHFDHASGVEEIVKANNNAMVIAPFELALIFMAKGLKNVIPMNCGGSAELEGIKYSVVGAAHTSSLMKPDGGIEYAGSSVGFVIEFEDGYKVYASGDTGLTSDMKFVVADYFKPDLAILPCAGNFVMEPEQAVVAATTINPKHVIPFHDFPEEIEQAASPEGYKAFTEKFAIVLQMRAKAKKFVELMKKHKKIKVTSLDFGESVEI